jgi:hypothetical protein
MSELWWAAPMLIAGGLFAGGVGFIAWERGPAWRASDLPAFRSTFARTLRRADRLQPALVMIWLVSTLGYAASTAGASRTLALLAAATLLTILVGSIVWLVPIQNRVAASGSEGFQGELEWARSRWLRGHLIRTVLALAAWVVVVVAALA